MPKDANVIGRTVAFLRYQRGWSQNDLVTQLHLLGDINMTREKIANIETLRSAVDSKQIEFLAEVFGVKEQALFPKQRHFVGKDVGSKLCIFTRQHGPPEPAQK
jgi:transcriptional regulator with XRE-family HTH domain